MSRIKGKDTLPEIQLRRLLREAGIRGYRIHYDLPGKPDVVFIKKKIAIFIDGCFWHKCPLHFKEPETRKEFWLKKIQENVKRDEIINKTLVEDGWKLIRIWEHELKENPEEIIRRIKMVLGYTGP